MFDQLEVSELAVATSVDGSFNFSLSLLSISSILSSLFAQSAAFTDTVSHHEAKGRS